MCMRLFVSFDTKTKRLVCLPSLPPGFEPGTFRLTAERANRLRHGSF
ncbi:13943_t:CDS:1, partial [Ambispora leptoticha]